MQQYRLPWISYRLVGNIGTGISVKRYARLGHTVLKPWVEPIRRHMADKGWTQGELAQRAGIRPNTLSEAMNGRGPRTDTLEAVAKALGVPLYELFISGEQSALLKQAAQSQQQLVHQEDLVSQVVQRLTPTIAAALQDVVNTPTPHAAPAPAFAKRKARA